jgi:hypothetical protein
VGGTEEVRPLPLDLTPALVAAAFHIPQLTQLWLRGTKLCDSSMAAVGQLQGLKVGPGSAAAAGGGGGCGKRHRFSK